jgi:hypothetical protein
MAPGLGLRIRDYRAERRTPGVEKTIKTGHAASLGTGSSAFEGMRMLPPTFTLSRTPLRVNL